MDIVQLIVVLVLVGVNVAALVYQTVRTFRLHAAGDLSVEDGPTVLDWCVLIAITLIVGDNSPFGTLIVAIAVYGAIFVQVLHGIDKCTLWLVTRHQTDLVPQQKIVRAAGDRYRK